MKKSLVIVESPAKARTINRCLGPRFVVKSCVGHIKDLPKNRLGVDVEGGFLPQYEVIKGKASILSELRKEAHKCSVVYLAPDPDREGEAIAWHLKEEIDGQGQQLYRVLFNEITKDAVARAIENPTDLNLHKYEAQKARRILDRLVGYPVSQLLWQKVRRGLSAGRVQSVALRLVSDREREIEGFRPEEHWTIDVGLTGPKPPPFQARLVEVSGKKPIIGTEAEAQALAARLRTAHFAVKGVEEKEKLRHAVPPFITSTLQQEASRKLRFSAKRTMRVAQRLYEGVDLGEEGPVALISYMRTDSTRIADQAIDAVRQLIRERYGPEYLPARPNRFKNRKSAQDAHEAIRPTYLDHPPEQVKRFLGREELALYDLIWRRFAACQMTPARFRQTTLDAKGGEFLLRATETVMTFPGFTAAYTEDQDNGGEEEPGTKLPPLKAGDPLKLSDVLPEQHFTQPPPRYTESSLIKELEARGIGRPSTYANILSAIQDRSYVEIRDRSFRLLEMGKTVTELLVKSFPAVFDVAFTAQLEETLDKIEEGKENWQNALGLFYRDFNAALERARTDMPEVKREIMATDLTCPRCSRPLVVRWGKNGRFLACSGYPDCSYSADFRTNEQGAIEPVQKEESVETCEKCGGSMVVKRSRNGAPFLACSNYPKCRNTRSLGGAGERPAPEPAGEKCSKCGGEMVIKRARNGSRFLACSNYPKCKNARPFAVGVSCPYNEECGGVLVEKGSKRGVFYGCSSYPACRYTLSRPPVLEPCPACGHPWLEERRGSHRDGSLVLRCPRKACGYEREHAGS